MKYKNNMENIMPISEQAQGNKDGSPQLGILRDLVGKREQSDLYFDLVLSNTSMLIQAVESGWDPNMLSEDSRMSPLHFAAQKNYSESAGILIDQYNSDVNEQCVLGNTPLLYALKNYAPDIVKMLINAGADLDQPDSDGLYPIAIAIDNQDLDILQHLIEGDVDLEIYCDDEGNLPLHLAVSSDNFKMTQMLLDAGVNINSLTRVLGHTPIHLAIEYNCVGIIDLLIKSGAMLDIPSVVDHLTPLQLALGQDKRDCLSVFLRNNVPLTDIDSIVDKMILSNALESIKLIFLHYTVSDQTYLSVINYLINENNIVMIDHLTKSPNASYGRLTMLMNRAIKDNDLPLVKVLYHNGAGQFPIHTAIKCMHYKIMKFFINKGICVNQLNNESNSPLVLAYYLRKSMDRIQFISALLKAGATTISAKSGLICKEVSHYVDWVKWKILCRKGKLRNLFRAYTCQDSSKPIRDLVILNLRGCRFRCDRNTAPRQLSLPQWWEYCETETSTPSLEEKRELARKWHHVRCRFDTVILGKEIDSPKQRQRLRYGMR
ncbi:MAG: ankyrin repeat domain-containing protein [Pseudomonadota bacterium]|nr:ankyrin repeat domain-containing protein [Pseudomonadota bacterium]